MLEGLIKSNIQHIDVRINDQSYPEYSGKVYTAASIHASDLPDWYYNSTENKTHCWDRRYELTMHDSTLVRDIDNYMACACKSGIYIDVVITATNEQQAAIQQASVLDFRDTRVTLVGGIYSLLPDPVVALKQAEKRIEKAEKDKPDLARFRHILEE
jgi:hypothetical protein